MQTITQQTATATTQPESVNPAFVSAVVLGIDSEGLLCVSWKRDENDTPLTLACELLLTGIENPPFKEGDRVIVLMPTEGQPLPCVLGKIGRMIAEHRVLVPGVEPNYPTRLLGEEVQIVAEEKLVVQCEEGSVMIQQDGTVAVRGSRILSRAKGVNKIKGGSVQLN